MEFNKKTSRKNVSKCKPTIVFRKLSGDKSRYQGSLNKAAVNALTELIGGGLDFNVLFSDQHNFIGLEPLSRGSKEKKSFGATELFNELSLVTGKHYTLKVEDGVGVIDADEFN